MKKKTLLFAAAALVLAACVKETPVKEDGIIDASKIVFNIQVENADATKAVKTVWETGDDVYVFFEGNSTQYVKMTYNGTSWDYRDKEGGTAFSGLQLAASEKKLCAVYIPDFVRPGEPTFDGVMWSFGSEVYGYYQIAGSVSYTADEQSGVTTLNATIRLTARNNILQIFIPKSEAPTLGEGNEFVLNASSISPCSFFSVYLNAEYSSGILSSGLPLLAHYGTLGNEEGYYFWGALSGNSIQSFNLQLVERNSDKKYAIRSWSKTITPGTPCSSSAAFKVTGWTSNGPFVSLGYAGGPLWATGNLDKTHAKIVDPLEAGEHFKFAETTPYAGGQDYYNGTESPISTARDAAYQANTAWRTPTAAQLDALVSNTYNEWKENWTSLGVDKGGRLVTSGVNGISIFFNAAGYFASTDITGPGGYGYYWSSDCYYNETGFAHCLSATKNNALCRTYNVRYLGYSIRPVKNN